VSLQSVLAAALEATRPQLVRSGQVLDVTLPEAPIWLDADPTRLTQVFSNLLDNAAKFSEPGGHVSVTTASRDGQVAVLVRDTGVGIPSDQLATIFDMFAQADHSVERSAGGLGIGLALVRGLVEMHGGSIQASSEGTKQGTEMRVSLPLAADVHATPEQPEPAARAHGRRRILVADDNQDSADSLVALLELAGHEAHAVYDGASAVEAAVRLQPDVVLLDLGMPRVSGHEAALRIRQGPARSAALVALTGWGDEQTRQRTHEEGFDAHLTKPVDFQELLALLDVS
jgi:CheY-like chemotaxis protein/anti-sigma regulatory factor (Ser/Thr protein kinase)